MRKWLQSKTFVTVLCVVAGGCIAANFIHLPKRTPLTANARMTSTPQEELPPIEVAVPPAFQPRDSAEAWRGMFPLETLNRDPFAPAGLFASASDMNNPPNSPLFILQAVSIEGDRSLAVINQTVLGEGEAIDGYRVDKILPTQVRLSGAMGSVTATLARGNPGPKAALGNSPAADHPAAPAGSRPAGNSP